MEDMNVILSLNEYSIYKNDNYFLCVPNDEHQFYHVFMGFSLKELNSLSSEELFMEIRKISDSIYAVYKNSVYVLPIIDTTILEEVASENDDRGYNRILKNIIQPITLSVYSKLMMRNVRVSQIIKMIKQNDADKKIVGWMSLKLGDNFIKEITFEDDAVNTTTPLEVTSDVNYSTSSKVISIDYQENDIWIKKEEEKISESLKPAFSPGFSSLKFMILVLTVSLVLGVILGYLILK